MTVLGSDADPEGLSNMDGSWQDGPGVTSPTSPGLWLFMSHFTEAQWHPGTPGSRPTRPPGPRPSLCLPWGAGAPPRLAGLQGALGGVRRERVFIPRSGRRASV